MGVSDMKDVRVRPWPFAKGELAELFWMCSPYLDSENNWVFKASFKDSASQIRDIKLQWGLLPDLCVGQYFIDGLPSEFPNRGSIEEVDVSKVTEYEICDAFDMPAVLYYFNQNPLLGKQKVCKFRANNRIYYVPCIEIVRSFLAPSRVLAYQLLRPNGLDALFEKITYRTEFYTASVDLSCDYPRSLVNEDNIIHLVWLKTYEPMKAIWDSVYINMYKKAIEKFPHGPVNGFKAGVPLEVNPILLPFGKWIYRGIRVNNYSLIFEIKEIKGLPLYLGDIIYTHPSFSKPEKVDEPKNLRVAQGNRGKEKTSNELSDDDANKNESAVVSASTKVKLEFMHRPRVRKVTRNKYKQRTGAPDESNSFLNSGKASDIGDKKTVSAKDWVYEGKVGSLEFKTIEVTYSTSIEGLEDFLKAISIIQGKFVNIKISSSIISLPDDKSFSLYENNRRRNCAIVKIEQVDILPYYIIEIGRADFWSISTLIIYHNTTENIQDSIEDLIGRLIIGVVNNNGHWDMLSLQEEKDFQFEMMKHVRGEHVGHWAERIEKKLY